MIEHTNAAAAAARQLAAIARTVGSSLALDETLDAVARAVVDALGFRAAVVNLLAPDGELHVVAVAGSDDVRTALQGTHSPLTSWQDMLAAAAPWGELRFLSHEVTLPETVGDMQFYVPELPEPAAGSRAGWHPQDALFAPLVDPHGNLLGVLSVDDPVDGRLPGPVQRAMLEAFAVHAAVAIDHARTHHTIVESEQQLRHLALHDVLTGLPNRMLIFDRIEQALARTRRDGGLVSVTVVDIDHFKLVNDSYGHPVGDQLLGSVARALREALRGVDTAGRLGGDEFVVVCEGVRSPDDAAAMADRLRAAVRIPVQVDGVTLLPSASLGCTVSTGDATADQLVAEADAALYRAKAAGRGRYEMFDEEMRRSSRSQMELRAQLVDALEQQQFRVHYQPIIDLPTGATVGYEALLRWEHPQRGLLLPGEFLHAVVDSELDVAVTRWVLRRAAADIVAVGRRSDSKPFVSVNLSARQLARPELVTDVQTILEEVPLPARRLWLEITEEHLIDRRHRPMLDRLQTLGCRIALDDFGTGYSGLTYLQQMPVNVLKIDREFIGRVGTDRVSSGITAAMTDLAEVLGIKVVAEGVETVEQAELLRGMGVGMAQGFFFGRPAPVVDGLPTSAPVPMLSQHRSRTGAQPPFVTVNDSMTTG